MTLPETCARLRDVAECMEAQGDSLLSAWRESLRGKAGVDVACMDLAMAQEALDNYCWWLRKTADDIVSAYAQKTREDGA